jgi:hypothetical protein
MVRIKPKQKAIKIGFLYQFLGVCMFFGVDLVRKGQ